MNKDCKKRKEDSKTVSSRHERLIKNACRWLIVNHDEALEYLTDLLEFFSDYFV